MEKWKKGETRNAAAIGIGTVNPLMQHEGRTIEMNWNRLQHLVVFIFTKVVPAC